MQVFENSSLEVSEESEIVATQAPELGQTVRDGPLEKLWGEGNFRAAGIFFRYQIPCMNFF